MLYNLQKKNNYNILKKNRGEIMNYEKMTSEQFKNEIAYRREKIYSKLYRVGSLEATRILSDEYINLCADAAGGDPIAEDILAEEWIKKADKISIRAKEEITTALKANNYDGVIIKNDEGSGGRRVETYIALDKTQVKSATENIGTFDRSNPDIRFALKKDSQKDFSANGEEFTTPTISTVGKDRAIYKEKTFSKDWRFSKKTSAYIHAVDEMYGIQTYLEDVGGLKNAKETIQTVRSAPHQVQSMIGSVQYNVFEADKRKARKLGEGLNEILKPIESQGETVYKGFNDYLLHKLNCKPSEYINNVRISAAETLLRETDMSVSEIAERVGYSDVYYFSKTFKRLVGCSPSKIR